VICLPLVDPQTLAVLGTLPWPHCDPPAWGIGYTVVHFLVAPLKFEALQTFTQVSVEVSFICDRQLLKSGMYPAGEWCFSTDKLPLELARRIRCFVPAPTAKPGPTQEEAHAILRCMEADLALATGLALDYIGAKFKIPRLIGELDETYRRTIQLRCENQS